MPFLLHGLLDRRLSISRPLFTTSRLHVRTATFTNSMPRVTGDDRRSLMFTAHQRLRRRAEAPHVCPWRRPSLPKHTGDDAIDGLGRMLSEIEGNETESSTPTSTRQRARLLGRPLIVRDTRPNQAVCSVVCSVLELKPALRDHFNPRVLGKRWFCTLGLSAGRKMDGRWLGSVITPASVIPRGIGLCSSVVRVIRQAVMPMPFRSDLYPHCVDACLGVGVVHVCFEPAALNPRARLFVGDLEMCN